jgi:ABC-2 type transport system permease protein
MTQTNIFKPTTMHRILGKNYKWWYIMVYNYKSASAYFWSDIFYYLNHIFVAYIIIVTWSISERQDGIQNLTYLIIGNMYLNLLLLNNHWRISSEVFNGKFSSVLILPVDIFKYYFFNALSYSLKVAAVLIFYIPILAYYRNIIFFNSSFFIILLLTLPIALVIKFFYNLVFGMSVFWLTNSDGVNSFSETLVLIGTGAFIPLSILGDNLIVNISPFSFLLHHPMQIYLGKYNINQTILVFAGGIAWCVILYLLAKLIFKIGLKRNEAVGL